MDQVRKRYTRPQRHIQASIHQDAASRIEDGARSFTIHMCVAAADELSGRVQAVTGPIGSGPLLRTGPISALTTRGTRLDSGIESGSFRTASLPVVVRMVQIIRHLTSWSLVTVGSAQNSYSPAKASRLSSLVCK